MCQEPGAAFSPSRMSSGRQAPASNSSRLGLPLPRRLVNQALSGTSSKALTLTAGPAGSTANTSASGRNTELSMPSQTSGETYGSGAQAWCLGSFLVGRSEHSTETGSRSLSRQSGSRSGKRGCAEPQAASSSAPSASDARSKATGRPCRDAQRIDLAAGLERLGANTDQQLEGAVRRAL